MIKLYSPNTKVPCFLYKAAEKLGFLTNNCLEADFLLLPFKYEIIHDFSEVELHKEGITNDDLPELRLIAAEMDKLSVQLQKKMILFFYRDSTIALPFRNALIFRTSTFVSANRYGEYGMPAFIDDFGPDLGFTITNWKQKPSVSFRGSCAPLQLPLSIRLRLATNLIFQHLKFPYRVKNYYNDGYLLRRRAILSILKSQEFFEADFSLNKPNQFSDLSKKNYLKSLRSNDYFICTSGQGNYSFRLYEIMQAGRIPVFIQTDSLLPVLDEIPWRKLTVWIEASEVKHTAEKILHFHHSLKKDEFIELQRTIRFIWEKYLCYEGFSNYLLFQFLPLMKVELKETG
ncbi:MAG: hypothetical protein E6Q89_09340 [Bacteroidia bacterium]|nr:MAG: hypothetical protein E6Q89_09340 [Bacteroidia bacterium]